MLKQLFFIAIIFSFTSCSAQQDQWVYLFDQDLSQWDIYLSYTHKLGYDGSQPTDENGNLVEPVGLNKEGYDVYTMIKEGNDDVLKITGEYYGGLSTKSDYKNYHFSIQFKWGNKKYDPRKNLLKDSGVLYHAVGPHGVEHWRSWMLSQEFQVMEGHIGDYWSQKNSEIDIKAYIPEGLMSPAADYRADFISIGKTQKNKIYCMRSANYEKPSGEWNTLELITFEDKALHIVNGEVVMILQNSRYVKDGKDFPLTEGKIQLQSESAELFYKEAKIRSIDALPIEYVKYY